MMKRLVSLLAAILLLPVAAMAENAWQATLTWQADEAAAKQYLAYMGEDFAQDDAVAQGIAELVSGLEIQLLVQEDAFDADFLLKSESLFNLGIVMEDGAGYVLTNLLPGHALKAVIPQEQIEADARLTAQLEGLDWDDLWLAMAEEVEKWLASLPCTEETGHFIGDAYAGGQHRRSYQLDDRDVALLAEGMLMLLEERVPLDHDMNNLLFGGVSPFGLMREVNHDAALENRYDYLLHHVMNQEGATVGFSLTVMEAEKQVMTLSLGEAEDGFRLVWGYGLNGENYYLDLQAAWKGEDASAQVGTASLAIYRDGSHAGYQAVRDYAMDGLIVSTEASLQVSSVEGGCDWQAQITHAQPEINAAPTRYELKGSNRGDKSTTQSVKWYLGDGTEPCITMQLTTEPAQPMDYAIDTLTAIEMDDAAGMDKVIELVDSAVTNMTVKLFRLIPAQLLTVFMN